MRDPSWCYTRHWRRETNQRVISDCEPHRRRDREARLGKPQLDGKRLLEDLDALAGFGSCVSGAVNRVAYSPADLEARRWVETQMRDLGLQVTIDQAGNSICPYHGQAPELPPIAVGSHTDTVLQGGRYDGSLGVAAAMACVRALAEAGLRLRHPVEVINFAAEEATMGGTIGSRAMAGLLDPAILDRPAWDGIPVAQHLEAAGLDPPTVIEAKRGRCSLACFLELHIEQGGTLERSGVPLGVVEGIVGIRRYGAVFQGLANHAGTTPMAERHDALVLAAQFVLAVRDVALAHNIVGTVGTLHLQPGFPSVIPGRVELSVETRGLDEASLEQAEKELSRSAVQMGGTLSVLSAKPPARSDPLLVDILSSTCEELGVPYRRLPSGAGHDAMCMAHIAPQAMLFVPSRGGMSHSPEEFTKPEHCVIGARVLLEALLKIDSQLDMER
ncbi:MAG TPA: Zn-dependent hydrolase [Anaerolineae bacterium]|nr:Zn-dependent hydrolase [Anaerolineae bacterium]